MQNGIKAVLYISLFYLLTELLDPDLRVLRGCFDEYIPGFEHKVRVFWCLPPSTSRGVTQYHGKNWYYKWLTRVGFGCRETGINTYP